MNKEISMTNKKTIAKHVLILMTFGIFMVLIGQYTTKTNIRNNYTTLDEFILSALDNCPQQEKKCLKVSAKLLLDNASFDEVMSVIERNIHDANIFKTCHQITHEFGRIEYEKSKNIREVLGRSNHVCYEGYFHGAAEAYFLDQNISLQVTDERFKNSIPNVCGQIKNYLNSDLYMSCLHGLGHALMYVTLNEVPLALLLCDELATTSSREGCYSGIFMENRTNEFSVDHPTIYIRASEPDYPCTILESKYLDTCYGYQAVRVYINSSFSFTEAVKFCQSAPTLHQIRCISQVSGHMTGYPRAEELLSKDCAIISNSNLQSGCIIAVAKRFIQRDMGNLTSALRFCSAFKNSNKELCITTAQVAAQKWLSVKTLDF